MAELTDDVVAGDQYLCVHTPRGTVEITGSVVQLPGAAPVRIAPGPLSVMRALVKARGAVVSRESLLSVLPHCGSGHVLEMWISRLRQSLPNPETVQTVVKRGYRLAL